MVAEYDLKNAAAHGALLRGGGARAHQGGHGASQLRRRRLLGDLVKGWEPWGGHGSFNGNFMGFHGG